MNRNGFILVGMVCLAFVMLSVPARGEIIFSEDFESGSLGGRWEKLSEDPGRGDFEYRSEHVHSGKASFRITSFANRESEKIIKGYAYKESDSWIRAWFLPGYDRVYVRWYAKFAEDFDQGRSMHWCGLRGCRTDKPRSGFGRAGERPDGTDRFTTSIEPARKSGETPPGEICFYTYWPDMKISTDGRYWGNRLKPDTPFVIERGQWYCFELMVKLNEPGKKNGGQALWVDGEKIFHQDGFRWRDTDILKLNLFKFGLYIHYCEHDCTYWVDDLLISTDYVGPLNEPQVK